MIEKVGLWCSRSQPLRGFQDAVFNYIFQWTELCFNNNVSLHRILVSLVESFKYNQKTWMSKPGFWPYLELLGISNLFRPRSPPLPLCANERKKGNKGSLVDKSVGSIETSSDC